MTRTEEKYLLETTRENNRMLRSIIRYINHIERKANEENMDDFGRNVIANVISSRMFR